MFDISFTNVYTGCVTNELFRFLAEPEWNYDPRVKVVLEKYLGITPSAFIDITQMNLSKVTTDILTLIVAAPTHKSSVPICIDYMSTDAWRTLCEFSREEYGTRLLITFTAIDKWLPREDVPLCMRNIATGEVYKSTSELVQGYWKCKPTLKTNNGVEHYILR